MKTHCNQKTLEFQTENSRKIVYEEQYCGRGNMENRIKLLQMKLCAKWSRKF